MPIHRSINKNFFKKWSKKMAYVLGFIFADGNINCNKRGSWFWSIQITDKNILKIIKNTIGSTHKISQKKEIQNHKKLFRLQIGSKEMCSDLMNLGITERKSLNMKFPTVNKKYFGDFLRGYFDGDGGIWSGRVNKKRKKPVSVLSLYFTSGSFGFLKDLQKNLKNYGVEGGFIVKKQKGYDLKYSTKDALKIYKIMYNSKSPLFLTRKRVKFDSYINTRS